MRPYDFGSGHSSVVLEKTFTSQGEAETGGIGPTGVMVGGPDFSAVGMLPKPAAAEGGFNYDLSAVADLLVLGGQITVYAEAEVIAQADVANGISDSGSLGVNPPGTEAMFSTAASGSSVMWARPIAGGAMHNYGGASGLTSRYECVAIGPIVKYTYSWDPIALQFTTWIDDFPRDPTAMALPLAASFAQLSVGMNNAGAESLTIGRIVSITVSTEIPTYTLTRPISIAGDSYYNRSGFHPANTNDAAINESKMGVILQRALMKASSQQYDVPAGSPAQDSKYIDSAEANSLLSNQSAVVVNNPEIVFTNCGLNDIQERTQAQMEVYMETDIRAFLSFLYGSGVVHVIWNEVVSPYGNATDSPPTDPDAFTKVAWVNALLHTIAAGDPRLKIAGMFEPFGGDIFTPATVEECYVRGMLNDFDTTSARNDTHPSTFGNALQYAVLAPIFAQLGEGDSRIMKFLKAVRQSALPTANYKARNGGGSGGRGGSKHTSPFTRVK